MIKNIVIVVLSLLIVYFIFRPKEAVKEVMPTPVKDLVDAEVKRVNTKIDQKGFKHAVIDEVSKVVYDKSELNDSAKAKLAETEKLLAIKDKQLSHLLSYTQTIEGKLLQATKTDSSFNYSDKWTKIEYVPRDSGDGHFNFSYNAEVNYAEYWKRKNIFSKKEHYIDMWINDPRASINGVKRLKIAPKKDKTYVDINATSIYTDRLMMGADAHLHFGRTRIGGGYYYDFEVREWRPVVSVKWNVLEF